MTMTIHPNLANKHVLEAEVKAKPVSGQPPAKALPGYRLVLFGVMFAVCVIVLGAFTRLVDAGLGCPDWPGCYGHALWPTTEEHVVAANLAFPEIPVEHDKTWPEMVHRYLAEGLGLLTIAVFCIAVARRSQPQPVKLVGALLLVNILLTAATAVYGVKMEPYAVSSVLLTMAVLTWLGIKQGSSKQPFKLPAFLLAFIILQGLFGMWTVTLKLWPQVVTSHLMGGFTTFSLLWLLLLRLRKNYWRLSMPHLAAAKSLRSWAVAGLIVVVAQVALGGWTTSNYAALACPDLPTCQGQWLPTMDMKEGFNIAQGIGPNYLGGTMDNEARVAIHFSHRVGAIITTIMLIAVILLLKKRIVTRESSQLAAVIGIVLALQVLLGLGNIVFQFPVSVAVAHNLGGALLLITMVTLNYRLYTARPLETQ